MTLRRASTTLKGRGKENEDLLVRTMMENGLRSKSKKHFDDKFEAKEDNFISPS
jgi:hypothetical protein